MNQLIKDLDKVSISYLKNLDIAKCTQTRAGIIVYTIINNDLFFIVGIDTDSNDITDFGGGVNIKKGETVIKGGLRELMEESLGVFGFIKEEELLNCITVFNETSLIIFIPLKLNPYRIYEEFIKRIQFVEKPEVKGLAFLNVGQFITLIKGNLVQGLTMYSKIQSILFQALEKFNFIKLL